MASIVKVDISGGAELTITTEFSQLTVQSLFWFINSQASSYFTQQFKYSIDGGSSFTSYATLNEANIRAIVADTTQDIVVTYKYVQTTNPSTTGDLVMRGTYSELLFPIYDNTSLSDLIDFNDYEVLQWTLTVLEKLYSSGILPKYMTRNSGGNIFDDEDFISLWGSICHLFALIVIYGRSFQDIKNNETLIKYFLDSHGIYYNRNNSLADLQYIFENYSDEISKRGTNEILRKIEDGATVNGELLRLIDYIASDEFLFALTETKDIGWNIHNSSPMYRGTETIVNFTKVYEYTKDVTDLDLYPLENDTYISIDTVVGGGEELIVDVYTAVDADYIKIDAVPAATYSGISSTGDSTMKVVIAPDEDYEVSFRIRKDDTLSNINFGITAYDIEGNAVDLLNNSDSSVLNDFFTSEQVCLDNTKEYWVRGIIYKQSTVDNADDRLNIGIGNNLRFVSPAKYIIPNIRIEGNAASNTTYIRDIKIRPLTTPESQGSLGARNFIFHWFVNNSGIFATELIAIIRKYLLPYNCTYYPVFKNDSRGAGTINNYLLLNTGGFLLLNTGGKLKLNN